MSPVAVMIAARAVARAVAMVATLALAAGIAFAQVQGSVRARLGATTISIDETVTLVVVATGLDQALDTTALERQFDLVSRSSSREVEILDGERRSTVTWALELVPREVGVFTVPPVRVGDVESELLSLTVTAAPTGGEREVFVEAEVDDDTPWVQSQVLLTLRVLRAIDIVDGSLAEPAGDGLEVRALGKDRAYAEERDGRRYAVVERRYALFPQRSGRLLIDPVTLSVTVAAEPSRVRGFFSPTRRLTRRTDPIALEVRPRPPATRGWWLPARAVTLEERREGTPAVDGSAAGSTAGLAAGEARVGEPLTRTLRLGARGVLDTQLPELAVPLVDGLAVYSDDPVRDSVVGPDGVEAVQTLSLAIIPERPGTFELPPVTVEWFDVAAATARTATLPARTITVLPGDGGAAVDGALSAASTPDAGDDGDGSGERAGTGENGGAATVSALDVAVDGAVGGGAWSARRWRTLALAALVGWALTALALLRSRRRHEPQVPRAAAGGTADAPSEPGVARRRLERAARAGDVPALARAALERAALRWPDAPPRSLAVLARRLGASGAPDRTLGDDLMILDAALYGAAASAPSADALASLPARLEAALGTADIPAGRAPDALPPL